MNPKNTPRKNMPTKMALLLAGTVFFLIAGLSLLGYGLLIQAKPELEIALLFKPMSLFEWIANVMS